MKQFTFDCGDLVNNRGRRGNQLDVKFTLQPLLNNFHMQQAEKATAKTETEGQRVFRLKGKRGIV